MEGVAGDRTSIRRSQLIPPFYFVAIGNLFALSAPPTVLWLFFPDITKLLTFFNFPSFIHLHYLLLGGIVLLLGGAPNGVCIGAVGTIQEAGACARSRVRLAVKLMSVLACAGGSMYTQLEEGVIFPDKCAPPRDDR